MSGDDCASPYPATEPSGTPRKGGEVLLPELPKKAGSIDKDERDKVRQAAWNQLRLFEGETELLMQHRPLRAKKKLLKDFGEEA